MTPDVIYPEECSMCTWEDSIFCCFQVECPISSVQFSQSYPTLCDPTELQHTRLPCPSPTPGVVQTHVHWVSDAIQPSHPLLSPSPPAFNLSQHQGLYKWVSSLHQVAIRKGDNIQPWCIPFLISNQSVAPCPVLTVAPWPAYRFLRRQIRSGIPISFRIFHSFVVIHRVKDFDIVNKAEVDAFLELSSLFYDSMDVGNLISGSSAFSKCSLNIWKFSVHVLLKPSL